MKPSIKLLTAILFVNFLTYGLALVFKVDRGVVNMDYLLSLFFINNSLMFICYSTVITIVDVFTCVAKIYHFTPLALAENYDIALKFNYIENFSPLIGTAAALVSVVVIHKYVFQIASNNAAGKVKVGMTCFILLLAADESFGTFNTNGLQRQSLLPNPLNINVATSGLSFVANEFRTTHLALSEAKNVKPMKSAMGIALQGANVDAYPKKIILIILESFGLFNDASINNEVQKEFLGALKKSYSIQSGALVFNGATSSGEMRELCGVLGDYHIASSKEIKDKCLPGRLHNQGYEVAGLHYYFRSAFNREHWWPIIGISNRHFLDSYNNKTNSALCGGFLNGGCDKDLIIDLFNINNNQDRSFSYALTLNSHLPVYRNKDIIAVEGVKSQYLDKVPDSVKLLVNSWRVVLLEVAEQINNRANTDLIVVVVGDHAPPYLGVKERSLFSESLVPYIILRIKEK